MNASYLSLSCSLHTRHTAEERSALLICDVRGNRMSEEGGMLIIGQ
jgi:hypothetical protein